MSGDHTLDIGIGRLPVKTKQEAKDVVDKLIYYDDNNNRTDGKRNITFVADDGDFNIHQQDADYLAETLTSKYPDFYTKKVFIDALPKVTVATGQKSPKTNELINKALDNSLIINYTGHGGTGGWAEEQILTVGDIQSWKNKTTLPLMVTATCEFGRYDDPSVVSGAELALLKPNAGVIGLLTTTRPVFANTNFLVNDAFYKAVFQPINKQMPRLGDVMIQTKNNSLSGRINRNFSLLGDPSMRLTYPSRKMVLRTINEKPFGNDTLKALQKVVLEGEVLTMDGQSKDSTFNDYFGYTLYDKLTTTTTLGSQSSPMIFKERKDILSIGGYIVNRGTFKISFTMPKDIDYRYGLGKIFFNNAGISKDFSLGSVEIMIGGSGEPALLPDKSPPAVEIKLFVSNWIDDGLVTNANPFFVAKMFDESGINIVNNSIGHELLLTIDDSLKYNLNDYYKRDIYVNTSTGGFVEYQLKDLKVGKHTLKFRAWDVYNNFTERSLSFRVAGQSSTLRTSTQNNPFVGGSEYVSILYYQALSAEGLELNAEIIGQNGQIIRRFDTASMKDAYSTDKGLGYLTWDGKNDSRSLVPKGIYFYRIFVNSALEGSQAVGFGKIGRF